jgi:hypothetical protein
VYLSFTNILVELVVLHLSVFVLRVFMRRPISPAYVSAYSFFVVDHRRCAPLALCRPHTLRNQVYPLATRSILLFQHRLFSLSSDNEQLGREWTSLSHSRVWENRLTQISFMQHCRFRVLIQGFDDSYYLIWHSFVS